GIFTRSALVPLLVVPLALMQWRHLFSQPRPRQDLALFSVSLIATGCVVITFTGLHLWESLATEYRLAKGGVFPAHSSSVNFSFHAFTQTSLRVLQLALPLAILHAKRVLTDERL